jgi:lipoprotein
MQKHSNSKKYFAALFVFMLLLLCGCREIDYSGMGLIGAAEEPQVIILQMVLKSLYELAAVYTVYIALAALAAVVILLVLKKRSKGRR